MSFGYVTIDGERVEVHVAAAFQKMAEQFRLDNGYTLHINSGTRTREEQEYLYNGWIRGLPGFNLAARPGTSNHEEGGPSGPRAIDVRDSAPFAGVMTRGTKHDRWMEQNAHRWEFENEGYYFSPVEAWHKTFRGVIGGAAPADGSSIPIDEKVLREQQFLNAARGENLVPDGRYGTATKAAYERYQVFLRDNGYGYTGEIDGVWGDGTQAAHAKYYPVWAATQWPDFPLPAGYYFGPADGPEESISGLYSYEGALKPWQQRMKDRGWTIEVDGVYGDQTRGVATAFQEDKDLTVDGLIGPETWDAAWTAPITPPAGTTPPPVEQLPTVPSMPKTPGNPRGLPEYMPVYPGAYIGLMAPLGDGPRGTGYSDQRPVPVVIDQFHIHRTGTNGDDGDWFSYRNSRSSCPHLHIQSDGRVREFIRPKFKPALTGPDWNWRGYGVEIQGAGDGTEAQFEAVADAMAWLASYEGKELDGIPVKYHLRSRTNVTLNHREMIPGTECPGDWWANRMDALILRAREILASKYAPQPEPEEPDVPVVPAPTLAEIRVFLQTLRDNETANAEAIDELLEKVPTG